MLLLLKNNWMNLILSSSHWSAPLLSGGGRLWDLLLVCSLGGWGWSLVYLVASWAWSHVAAFLRCLCTCPGCPGGGGDFAFSSIVFSSVQFYVHSAESQQTVASRCFNCKVKTLHYITFLYRKKPYEKHLAHRRGAWNPEIAWCTISSSFNSSLCVYTSFCS